MAGWWYWRIQLAGGMSAGHGIAETREGAVEQIAANLLHSPLVLDDGTGVPVRLVIQPPYDSGGPDGPG